MKKLVSIALVVGCGAAQTPASSNRAEPSVDHVVLSVVDIERASRLFEETLGAREIESAGDRVTLAIGEERIELVTGPDARPYPDEVHSNDLDFQHLALVTHDIDAAFARVRSAGVRGVSPEPQRIPESNPAAGGIRAYYFRDGEGHPLELIWYPENRGDPRWQHAQGDPLLGIDHTAIVVSSTDASVHFYVELLGLHVAGTSFNEGIEQELLSGVPGARVRITGLRGASGPGVELLEYVSPGAGRIGETAHWETVIHADDADEIHTRLQRAGIATQAQGNAFTVRDPDGHVIRVERAQ
jgi:catechol 2,3-dioxygenase-like lactoylglutathione lyase family enzyme